ncbi:class I SAM-dependent methyltransferase [Bosea sp. UC22_33]|uniref:class I SAM-dependent methyltransferase n=1 Tax=Bosea sp. UC22_33 TaxID=3350165 RepID=UPI0036730BEC
MIAQLRSQWARFWLRRSKFSGSYHDLQRLYAIKDPWNLGSAKEQHRFAASNAIIRRIVGDCDSLLELGCGEGFQTVWLAQLSHTVAGIDVSEKAVERARLVCPQAELKVGTAEGVRALFPQRRFDLVTAFEVLYYSNDIGRVLDEMQQISDCLLVTNYAERARQMRTYFVGPGWSRLEDIVAEGTVWEAYTWKRPQSQ